MRSDLSAEVACQIHEWDGECDLGSTLDRTEVLIHLIKYMICSHNLTDDLEERWEVSHSS